MQVDALNPLEKRTAISLSLVFALRMLGLFMIMPVFAIYGQELIGYSPMWVGLAIGAYGLTQALLQIPAGMLSDKFGRRPIIYVGLLIFAIGSLVAAYSESVYGVTLGRALQGAGAIASAVLALAADVTREEQRPKAMGMIGVSIGLAFAVSMVAGPVLAPFIGLQGLFLITAGGALIGIAIVHFLVPHIVSKAPRGETVAIPAMLGKLAKNPQLLRLNVGIFTLHMTLTAVFIALPLQLQTMHLEAQSHWYLYLPALLLSFLLIIPMLIVAAKKEKNRQFYLFSILLMALSLVFMAFTEQSLLVMFLCMLLYFTAFNFLEASLPAFISMLSPAGAKGSAMGIYSTYQFLGAFFGGILGGVSYKLLGNSGLFLFLASLMLMWFFVSWGMHNPSKIRTHTLTATIKDEHHATQLTEQLIQVEGVLEVVIIIEEQTVYIKVNNKIFTLQAAKQILV
ncbi:MFS transporter [Psychromonas sp. psych-6C06]|uniref:MFS transporter n=1 Tax=Psychromonas sp. psych-6C06 TaxID=2058089 RepID=UPI000C3206CF|nr:MFS transporter [Psychromonas sp. psych-6C06]PKF61636.1 MFS transporter [Psychromonas sp. psych-6C06]